MSGVTPNRDIDTVRRGIGGGDRLVPGTMSEDEHDALAALDRLASRIARLEEVGTRLVVWDERWPDDPGMARIVDEDCEAEIRAIIALAAGVGDTEEGER